MENLKVSLKGWQSALVVDDELRSAVTILRTKLFRQEAVILALLPHLEDHQKRAIREHLPEVATSGSQSLRVEAEMGSAQESSRWLRVMTEALES